MSQPNPTQRISSQRVLEIARYCELRGMEKECAELCQLAGQLERDAAVIEAARAHHCIECGNTGKVLDPMAWHDKPENYHECEACKALRQALADSDREHAAREPQT